MTKPGQAQDEAMDAILASIRSMMADGESVGKAAAQAEPDSGDPRPAANNVSRLFSETPPAAPRAEVASMPSARPVSKPNPDPVADATVDTPVETDQAVELAMVRAMEEARVEIERGARAESEEPVTRDEEPRRPAPKGENDRHEPPIAPANGERRPTANPEPPPGEPVAQPLEPLLSREADAAVSGAFRDLATSVLTGSGRTIDDVVEDLLRPMLRDWLDDNLPSLVERLVREEIERVARGRR